VSEPVDTPNVDIISCHGAARAQLRLRTVATPANLRRWTPHRGGLSGSAETPFVPGHD